MNSENNCVVCGAKFNRPANTPHKKYCSYQCARKVENERIRAVRAEKAKERRKEMPEKVCLNCSKKFIPKRHITAKFCCEPCQNKYYRKTHAEEVKEWKRRDYYKHWEKRRKTNNTSKDKLRFGGLRRKVLKRDNNTCTQCGLDYVLVHIIVHHIDEDTTNNIMGNLITLCRSCHNKVHLGTLKIKTKTMKE